MKRIFVSQRVDIHSDYGERRDALDQKWSELLYELNCICIPVPNHAGTVVKMLDVMHPDGILLTGGNNPIKYGGNAPERDNTDSILISFAVDNNIPLLGVCRGMQSIVIYFGGTLDNVNGHIAVRHTLDNRREVNSFHSYSPASLSDFLVPLAHSDDGKIESIKHKTLPIMGIMWHPEREPVFQPEDMNIFGKLFEDRI
jgi:putative glutamine amidotransferase